LGLSHSRVKTILAILKEWKEKRAENIKDFNQLLKIQGVGPWTVKAWNIICNASNEPNILLSEDGYINKMWKILLKESSIDFFSIEKITEYPLDISPTNLSKLLWRITPCGIKRLCGGKTFTNKCFL
jgi:3-methyladenine DNA glycosylase/8-oxoguanine DNA glycosylase